MAFDSSSGVKVFQGFVCPPGVPTGMTPVHHKMAIYAGLPNSVKSQESVNMLQNAQPSSWSTTFSAAATGTPVRGFGGSAVRSMSSSSSITPAPAPRKSSNTPSPSFGIGAVRRSTKSNGSRKKVGDKRKRESSDSVSPKDGFIHEDGFSWKKYGSKLVKGSSHPRFYFRCRTPDCRARKTQEMRKVDGRLQVHTEYKEEHNHKSPDFSSITVSSAAEFQDAVARHYEAHLQVDGSGVVLGSSAAMEKESAYTRPRFVVTIDQVVDPHRDGFEWRKYGQKNVKNRKFPRSYYKCNHGDCPVRKQVEELQSGQMMCTYECYHNHLRKGDSIVRHMQDDGAMSSSSVSCTTSAAPSFGMALGSDTSDNGGFGMPVSSTSSSVLVKCETIAPNPLSFGAMSPFEARSMMSYVGVEAQQPPVKLEDVKLERMELSEEEMDLEHDVPSWDCQLYYLEDPEEPWAKRQKTYGPDFL